VLLADDHRLVAEGLRRLLEPHFKVVGIVSDGRELVAAAMTLDPEAACQMRAANCRARIVFLTMHRELSYATRAMQAGASGFLLKDSAPSELMTAVQEAAKGGTYVSPQIAADLVDSLRRGTLGAAEGREALTPRQRDVLRLVAEGSSAKKVASVLGISRRTAEFHKARLMETLGVQTTAGLVLYALRTGVCSL
jgi:DNA-binding NarL/FixJ family response regulator